MKILDNIYILFSDIADFSKIKTDYSLAERLIDNSDKMFNKIEEDYGGTIRNTVGDAYILTFTKIEDLLESTKYIHTYWSNAYNTHNLLRLRLGIHKGKMLHYKKFFGGESFNIAAMLESSGKYTNAYQDYNNIVITHVSDLIMKESIIFNKNLKKAFIKVRDEDLNNNNFIKHRKKFFKTTYIYNPITY